MLGSTTAYRVYSSLSFTFAILYTFILKAYAFKQLSKLSHLLITSLHSARRQRFEHFNGAFLIFGIWNVGEGCLVTPETKKSYWLSHRNSVLHLQSVLHICTCILLQNLLLSHLTHYFLFMYPHLPALVFSLPTSLYLFLSPLHLQILILKLFFPNHFGLSLAVLPLLQC